MSRSHLLCLTALLACFLALVFAVVALATNEWTTITIPQITVLSLPIPPMKISFSVWKLCIEDLCATYTTVKPAVLAIIAAALLMISLIIGGVIIARKAFESKIVLLLMALLFASLILLLSTIGIFEHEITKSIIDYLMGTLTAGGSFIGGTKNDRTRLDILHTLIGKLHSNASNAAVMGRTVDTAWMKYEYGYSSILLISALPLTAVGLVGATYLAALHENA